MITGISASMMRRSFQRQTYEFGEVPAVSVNEPFGIYVNVPLCHTKCSFCPFYKELYTPESESAYLTSILSEIEYSPVSGRASWVYFGGGTPNTLLINELARIVRLLKSKVVSPSWGIELLPEHLDRLYLDGLARTGFTKISIGVESFDRHVIYGSGRKLTDIDRITDIVGYALSLGLWVNADVMVGLPGQAPQSFLADIGKLVPIGPSQVTIYPYMVIRGLEVQSPLPDNRQFDLIEQAASMLSQSGYTRKGVWTFARGDDVYDSSRDELVADYAGFGPAAFSTYGGWKVVNPELSAYVKSLTNGNRMAFVAPKSEVTDAWRRFAREIYDLRAPSGNSYPPYTQAFIVLLRLGGYIRNGNLTPKGVMFAHHITKAVVESLPFPVQNPAAVTNYPEYLAYRP